MRRIDLHMHSYYSDGAFSPADLLQKCKEHELEIISLTDHENVGGIPGAKEAGKRLGIRVIPGIEFSADSQGEEHHILGYFIDYQGQKLNEFLRAWGESKVAQVEKIIKNLQRFGFKVSLKEVMAQARGSIDRYHIFLAMFPDFNKSAVGMEKQKAFFRKYLLEKSVGGEGLAFAGRDKPNVQSVIDIIHDSKGLAFWAHPFWKIKDMPAIRDLALAFRKMGLDGIEVLYSLHDREQALFLHETARGLSMYESAGSDFHREDSSIRQVANFQAFDVEINYPFQK